ncbi:MAG: EAL domain-containing protein [Arcobacter sp.]|uniref:putative bifunctional diguanylate cyclase/phosphodiesterase n=1 Tax=Arcobacter sp. TaxID=1872629 RepID=UPI002590FAE0|nr:EAL domain-containing protein [Arcobacter sp.]MDD3008172.1 EAL domain-containing protein [Arcobacter sp.]
MIYNIQKFILFFLFSLLVLFYIIFSYYFFKQEEEVANVILKSLKNNITETSYTLSKNIEKKEDVFSYRALLDRITSNEDFIKAILVYDNEKLLLTTEPSIRTLDKNIENINLDSSYKKLIHQKYIEENIRFYEGKNQKTLLLVYILEKEEIYSHFIKNKFDFILYFGLSPVVALAFLIILLRIYVTRPLELLRQFAYYNTKVPKAFKLKELEAIRRSMVDSFSRLENEKKELYLMARTDSLSGLANRNSLNEFVERLIPTAERNGQKFAFLFLDIDHFKTVNDSLGHNIGDELLQNIASIIKKTLRPTDFVARIGGDEFAIIIQDYNSYLELSQIIKRIQKQLGHQWIIQTHPINISCSIGVAFYPKDGNDIFSLMKNADIAMYQAKKLGRNQYHFFTEELNQIVQNTINLDKDMRQALIDNEYCLFYQPKVDLLTSKIVGVEALIRWISPTKGFIAPNVFIPLAEENGFIKELGNWIVEEALNQHLKWKEMGIDINISINISAKQLLDKSFVPKFINTLENKNINPSKIDLEITEYMFMEESKETKNNLNKLHNFGVTISLDDFGTGYSSLSYLKKFPIDYLKVDKAFLDDFNSVDGSIFLETIVKMGQMLKMKVIAEGVETQEQIDYLKSISCDQYQGYYFSKPLSSKDFEKFYFKN